MEGNTYQYTGEMVLLFCVQCGCAFTMPIAMKKQRLENKETFYCPSGHGQSYVKSEADSWKEKYERADSYIRQKNERIERLERALRGRITRLSRQKKK